MQLIHSQLSVGAKEKKPTKKQIYHEQMKQALRRRQYVDFITAASDPEVMIAMSEVQKISPGFEPVFEK